MPQALVETLVAIVAFLLGIPARVEFWSCLLCKASGEPFFPESSYSRVSYRNPTWKNRGENVASPGNFQIDCDFEERRQRTTGASHGLAALVVCQTHPTHRIHGGVAMPQALVETLVAIVSFLLGIPARVEFWSCLLCKTSGEPLFSSFQRVSFENPNSENRDRSEKKCVTFRSIEVDVGGSRATLVPPRPSRRSRFVRHTTHIEFMAVWRCRSRLPRR